MITRIKLSFLVLIILIIGERAHSQINKYDMGLEGSPSLTFLRGSLSYLGVPDFIDNNHTATIGFSSGIFFQYNLSKVVSLRTNIAFERKGSILTSQVPTINGIPFGEVTINTNFDYLTLPILVRTSFGEKVDFFVNVGPYFSYLLKQTSISKGENIPTTTTDNTSLSNRFDAGISTGLGLSVPIKTNFAFSFEARNNLGLYNVSAVGEIYNEAIKTNSTNLFFGFAYKFGQRTPDNK